MYFTANQLYYLVGKASSCTHSTTPWFCMCKHSVYTYKISVFGGSIRGKIIWKSDFEQRSKAALSVCFIHLMPFKGSHSNIFQSLQASGKHGSYPTPHQLPVKCALSSLLSPKVFSQNFRDWVSHSIAPDSWGKNLLSVHFLKWQGNKIKYIKYRPKTLLCLLWFSCPRN